MPCRKTMRLALCALACAASFSCDDAFENYVGNFHESDYAISKRAVFREIQLEKAESFAATDEYSVLVITDTHFSSGENAARAFSGLVAGMEAAQKEKIAFCAVLGDLSQNGLHEEYAAYADFRASIEAQGIPVFSIPGNHDTYDGGGNGRNYINDVFPTTFFRIKLGGISFYFVDTADGTLGQKQLDELSDRMRGDPNKKVVFSHYPSFTRILTDKMPSTAERAKVLSLYAKNDVAFEFAGHTHEYTENDFGRFRTVTLENLERRKFILLNVNTATGGLAFSHNGF